VYQTSPVYCTNLQWYIDLVPVEQSDPGRRSWGGVRRRRRLDEVLGGSVIVAVTTMGARPLSFNQRLLTRTHTNIYAYTHAHTEWSIKGSFPCQIINKSLSSASRFLPTSALRTADAVWPAS